MTKFKTAVSLALMLAIAPQALAHDAPLPHQHGLAFSPVMWGTFFVGFALLGAFAWKALKQGDE